LAGETLRKKSSQVFLYRLAGWLYGHHGKVLISFAVITAVFASLAARLEQKTSVRDLLPEDNEVIRRFEDTVTDFGLVDRVVIVVSFSPEQVERAEMLADILVDEIRDREEMETHLAWVTANLFASGERVNWHRYLELLTRLIPEAELDALIDRLSDEGIAEQMARNRRDLASGMATKQIVEKDPLGLLSFASHYSKEIIGHYRLDLTTGYLVNEDQDMLLILGKPLRSSEHVASSVAITRFLEDCIAVSLEVLAEEEELAPDQLPRVGLTGPHAITAYENEIIEDDVVQMFVTSFVMVILLFVIAYRRPLAMFYVGIPLLCAEVWTLGISYLLFGRLNLLTAAFSAVIVGLGIDYAIHIFSRYLDERVRGRDPLEAMKPALGETGLGTIVGGTTTALAFGAIGIGNFSGLRELAFIAAIGIVLCLVQMFVLLPCLLFLRDRRRREDRKHRAQRDFHLEKVICFFLKWRKSSLAVMALLTLFLALQAIQLRFTTDMREVRARSNPSITLQNQVTEKVGGSLRSLTFVIEAEDEAALYAHHDDLVTALQGLVEAGDLVRFDSLLSLLQDPESQRRNIRAFDEAGITREGIVAAFSRAIEAEGMRTTPMMATYLEHLAAGVAIHEPVALESIMAENPGLVRSFIHQSDGVLKTVVQVYPSKGLYDNDAVSALQERIFAAMPETTRGSVFVTGMQRISEELKSLVRSSFFQSTAFSMSLVLLLLLYHFRRWSLVLLTLTPLVVAMVWMLGTMHLLGIDITIINFVATPLIIGIGIDDGVHIVEKYLHRSADDLGALMTACGKAVTLTSLTTILGFSSFFTARYSGFTSLGFCTIIGVLFCWLGSVILLPLLIDQLDLKHTRAR